MMFFYRKKRLLVVKKMHNKGYLENFRIAISNNLY